MSNTPQLKRTIDMSVVDRKDRTYVKSIIMGVLHFEDPMPTLHVNIVPTDDRYLVMFIGWDQEIDDQLWFETFLKTSGHDKRESKYDYIISTGTVPLPETTYGDDNTPTGPVKVFRVKRGAFEKKYKKQK